MKLKEGQKVEIEDCSIHGCGCRLGKEWNCKYQGEVGIIAFVSEFGNPSVIVKSKFGPAKAEFWFCKYGLKILEDTSSQKQKETLQSIFNSRCPGCGAPAYCGFVQIICSKSCCSQYTEALDETK